MGRRKRMCDGTSGFARDVWCIRGMEVQPCAETLMNPFARCRRLRVMSQYLQFDSTVLLEKRRMLFELRGFLERMEQKVAAVALEKVRIVTESRFRIRLAQAKQT